MSAYRWSGDKQVMKRGFAGLVTVLIGLLRSPQVAAVGPNFIRIPDPPFAAGGAQALVWGDFNGDGWMDLYCTVRSSAVATLYTNNTAGGFGRASGLVGANLVNPVGATSGDYDNDGRLDLFIANNNGGHDSLLHNVDNNSFSAVKGSSIVASGGNGNGCAWADYDRDGWLDLYVANSDGNNFLFHNQGNGAFTRLSTGVVVSGTGNSQGVTWIDYDDDGFPDLFVTRWQAVNLLFHNNRDGSFTKITQAPIATAGGTALGFCWGDFDNDGLADLFVANTGTNNFLYHNQGNGSFVRTRSPIGADSGSFQTANWIDYDNDGWLDLFVTSGTVCRLYHNNSDGTFSSVSGEPLLTDKGRWFAAAWADFNNDGFPDVVLSNVNNPNVLYQNAGNDNHWLTVHCLGRLSNRAAIGAKVRARATVFGKEFWQLREIAAGGNTGSQDQLDPVFGFGDATQIETIRVEWPSGVVQELHAVAVNQMLTLKEPSRLEAVVELGTKQAGWRLRGGKDLIYDIEQSANLQAWTPWISLTNLTGQLTFSDDLHDDFRVYRARER